MSNPYCFSCFFCYILLFIYVYFFFYLIQMGFVCCVCVAILPFFPVVRKPTLAVIGDESLAMFPRAHHFALLEKPRAIQLELRVLIWL